MTHQVIAIERDVEHAGWDVKTGDFTEASRETTRQMIPLAYCASERQVFNASIAFQDFVRDAGEGAANPVRIHDD